MHVVTLHTPEFSPAEISIPTIRSYCAKWGYSLHYHGDLICPERVAAWNKITAVEDAFAEMCEGDWLAWIDADILILREQTPLESFVRPKMEMIFSSDRSGLCTGFFLIRKSQQTQNFLKRLYNHYCLTWPWEQSAVKTVIADDEYLTQTTAFISSSVIQNPHSSFYADAFAMHYWCNGLGPQRTKKLMSLTLQYGWSRKMLKMTRIKHRRV